MAEQVGTAVAALISTRYTLRMLCEWDDAKAMTNEAKHGVTFEEAETVFTDPLAAIFDDAWHSGSEEREIIVGHSDAGRLLVVSFVERAEVIRIISAGHGH